MAKTAHEKTIASIKRTRTKRLATLATKAYYLHRRKQDEKLYELICEEFVSLGGVYIKFLQGVLLGTKIMRKWHNPKKLNIFENLDSEPINIAELLRHELPKDRLTQIAMVQPQPFAAGSFGQVYYGQLRNGQPIIIKVLRPMVRELLRYDLRLLNRFSKTFFSKLNKNMSFQLTNALEEFSTATLRETDYRHEAEFANELYIYYKNHPKLIIPQTYLELCTDDIIIQDYIEGVSVAQVVRMHSQGVDPRDYVLETTGSDVIEQLKTLGYESMMAIFTMPRLQGDPHPGNIRLMKDNKVGLIDFGISATAPKDKSGIYGLLKTYDQLFKGSQSAITLFEQTMRFFVGDLYRALRKLGDYVGKNDKRDYVSEVSQVAGDVFEQMTGSSIINADFKSDAGILNGLSGAMNKGNRFGLVMKLEATEIMRAIQTYTTLLASLGLYQEVMVPTVDKAVRDITTRFPDIGKEPAETVGMGEAIETVTAWLERIANRDPLLFRQLSEKIRMTGTPTIKPEGDISV